MNMREVINVLEKEVCEDISEDGTLTINVEDGTKVSRVFVCGDNHFGGLYYPEQEPCVDAISRREAIKKITYNGKGECIPDYDCDNFPVQIAMKTVKKILRELPPVKPQYTDAEIQKMQDLEFAEIQKAYELGKAEMQLSDDCISRQAVLDEINRIGIKAFETYNDYSKLYDFVDTLSPVKPQPCEDCISRVNTIGEVSHIMLDHPLDGYEDEQLILKTIQDMPPVTPKQKMGQWIVKSDKFVEWGVCSLCKENSYEPFAYAKRHFKYCPQCGSKMQEMEE